jgi:predicted dehydrogenase
MQTPPIRVGVIGVGHLGSLHAKIYAAMPAAKLEGICDINPTTVKRVASLLGCPGYTDLEALLPHIDAVSLAVPTSLHYALGRACIAHQKHLLIEKPLATQLDEADALVALADQAHVMLQVGHVERFNAAIHTASQLLRQPKFIESHRLSPYTVRGTDVSVVLDLMIHDLDVVLAFVQSPVTRVEAVGITAISASEDLASARLEFEQGTIANLTASRVSEEAMRKIRIFQDDAYLSIDYMAQEIRAARKVDGQIQRETVPITRVQPLEEELKAFVHAIQTGQPPVVSGAAGRDALAVALQIEAALRRHAVRA